MNNLIHPDFSRAGKSAVGELSIQNPHKQYPLKDRSLKVLEGINLGIGAGEFVSIVGSGACGKSTILRRAVGLDAEYQGRIYLKGEWLDESPRPRPVESVRNAIADAG